LRTYLGIDNGVSGSVSVIYPNGEWHVKKMPVKKELSYTKKKQYISRIIYMDLYKLLLVAKRKSKNNIRVFLERPLLNPTMFKASISALRALESTLIAIEEVGLSLEYLDSKQWQKEMLPKGIKGSGELKKASAQIGERLFPGSIVNGDCDGILIAEWARRKKL